MSLMSHKRSALPSRSVHMSQSRLTCPFTSSGHRRIAGNLIAARLPALKASGDGFPPHILCGVVQQKDAKTDAASVHPDNNVALCPLALSATRAEADGHQRPALWRCKTFNHQGDDRSPGQRIGWSLSWCRSPAGHRQIWRPALSAARAEPGSDRHRDIPSWARSWVFSKNFSFSASFFGGLSGSEKATRSRWSFCFWSIAESDFSGVTSA